MVQPKWFVPAACVIFHRRNSSNTEFLLGKRKEKEAEGGKWALIGGTGAFWEGAESPVDFARREAVYDLEVPLNPEKLRHFANKIKCSRTSLVLEICFSYEFEADRDVEVTGKPKAPDTCRWFSMDEVREMQQRGEIAFDNCSILEEFFVANSKTG